MVKASIGLESAAVVVVDADAVAIAALDAEGGGTLSWCKGL